MKKFLSIFSALLAMILIVLAGCKTESDHIHTWETAYSSDATITSAGEITYKCSVCKEIRKELYCGPLGEDGKAATTSSTYVYFGVFPKTVLSSTSTVTVDEIDYVEMGANTYYKGSDGEWYAKATENCYKYGDSTYTDGTTGNESSASSTRYFKVEPVKWKVLTKDYNSTGKSLLLAEEILTANVPYYKYNPELNTRTVGSDSNIYPNNYKYSQIRAYLNGLDYYYDQSSTSTVKKTDYTDKGFLQTAFTTSAQNLIALTTVDNSADSTTDTGNNITKATDYICANTTDKIFLLSEKEVTTSSYGFAAYDSSGKDTNRIRKATDYAKANYADQSSTEGCGGWWWLRSPSYDSSGPYARNVIVDGIADRDPDVYWADGGVVPALSISLPND